jgi:hypothetical protein
MEPPKHRKLELSQYAHCYKSVTASEAKPWLSHCDGSIKSDILNVSFSFGSSSQSHDRGDGKVAIRRRKRARKQ